MNAILSLPSPAPFDASAGPASVGRVAVITAAWMVRPGALLVVGHTPERPHSKGIAQLERRRADRGPFRIQSWHLPERGVYGFAAAVRLPSSISIHPEQPLTLIAADAPPLLAHLPRALADGTQFSIALLELAADAARTETAPLGRFMLECLGPMLTAHVPGVREAMTRLCSSLAVREGCVEITGALPNACGFVQGWGPLMPEAADALLLGAGIVRAVAQVAVFARADVPLPAMGFVAILPGISAEALRAADALILAGPDGLSLRAIVEPASLDGSEAAGHLRDMLPRLSPPQAVGAYLLDATRPRYEGVETLSAAGLPVRAAVDLALRGPSGAALLGGWLFDQGVNVRAVALATHAGDVDPVRLDTRWTRVERPDVTDAFAEPGTPPPRHHDHGFVCHIPTPAVGEANATGAHLELTLASGLIAFVPVAFADGGDVVGLVDLYKPSGLSVIEDQLGPFLAPPFARAATSPVGTQTRRPSCETYEIVLPLIGPPELPRAALSQFIRDPLTDRERLRIVCGAAWHRSVTDELRTLLRFMGLPAIISCAPDARTLRTALAPQLSEVSGGPVLVAGPGVSGRQHGWRGRLVDAAGGGCAVPTTLFEDGSIRNAQAGAIEWLDHAPYMRAACALAGLPASVARQHTVPAPVLAATLDVCVLSRAALGILAAVPPTLSTEGEEAAFMLQLAAAGLPLLWVPGIEVFAPEPFRDVSTGATVARLTDACCLRAAWRDAAAAEA